MLSNMMDKLIWWWINMFGDNVSEGIIRVDCFRIFVSEYLSHEMSFENVFDSEYLIQNIWFRISISWDAIRKGIWFKIYISWDVVREGIWFRISIYRHSGDKNKTSHNETFCIKRREIFFCFHLFFYFLFWWTVGYTLIVRTCLCTHNRTLDILGEDTVNDLRESWTNYGYQLTSSII